MRAAERVVVRRAERVDIRAAVGLAQLAKLEHFNSQRAKLVERYNRRFAEANLNVILPFGSVNKGTTPAYHIYPVVFPSTGVRDSMSELLQAEGIQTSIHYNPVHAFSAFRKIAPKLHLPVTEEFAARELTLPLYPSLLHLLPLNASNEGCRLERGQLT